MKYELEKIRNSRMQSRNFARTQIAEITTYAGYVEFAERLRALGFTGDTSEGAPVCRWVYRRTIPDVMPLDQNILGFSYRWYKPAMQSSATRWLAPGLEIRMVTAPCFVATKIEAFRGRGRGDFQAGHDLEDIVSVVDEREELPAEVRAAERQRKSIPSG